MRYRLLVPFFAVTTFLASCGGGGGDGVATGPTGNGGSASATGGAGAAEGFWAGSTAGGQQARLVVLEDGEAWGFATDLGSSFVAFNGDITSAGPALSGNLLVFDLETGQNTVATASGTVSPRSSMDVSVQPGGTRLALAYSAAYDQPASLASLAGTYALTGVVGSGGLEAVPVTVQPDGRFAFTNAGCTVAGQFTPRPSGKNVFDLQASASGTCAIPSGSTVRGIGVADGTSLIAMGLVPDRSTGLLAVGQRSVAAPVAAPVPAPVAAGSGSSGTSPATQGAAAPAPMTPVAPALGSGGEPMTAPAAAVGGGIVAPS